MSDPKVPQVVFVPSLKDYVRFDELTLDQAKEVITRLVNLLRPINDA